MKENNEKPIRHLNVKFSDNKLEAYISISYLQDSEGTYPPFFTPSEIKSELSKLNVMYGLMEEVIEECSKQKEIYEVLIAKGESPVNGEDDILLLKFEVDKDIKRLNEDSNGRVDFKSIGAINAVHQGEVIAVRIPGKEGIAGMDVTGKQIKPKPRKEIKLKAAQGCEQTDENTIVSSINGKPSMKNNTFYVYKSHQITKDVDLGTGNIAFLGDVIVQGNVREGMKVYSGNCITIMQNVEKAEIKGIGEIIVKGNVINSNVVGGGEDAAKLKTIENLSEFKRSLKEMVEAIEEIKKFNLLGYDTTDGQIIKLLLENKYRIIPKLCMLVISEAIKDKQKGDLELYEISSFVKAKLIGLAPHNIKHYSELFCLIDLIKEKIKVLQSSLSIPVNVKLAYCQDSQISSSGDIIVSGRGAYVSHLTAHHDVYFTQPGSVCRGGVVKAGNYIKCKQVGSTGGVVTRLNVLDKGQIWVDAAYENTILTIGCREFVVDYPSKDVHAYLDEDREIVVERLRL